MRRRLCLGLLVAVALLGACGDSNRVLVGAGTTTVDSGFIHEIESRFDRSVSIVAGSTAEILELAGQGSLDVAIVHDERQEAAFLESNPGAVRRPAFTSRFLIVGPADLVNQMVASTPAEAFAEIAAMGWTFVTRQDGSGTYAREIAIWEQSGVEPAGEWYLATGQGMGFTLQVANQRAAFTLVEEGAFLAGGAPISLVELTTVSGPELVNPYSAILVAEAGREFYDWLLGSNGSAAITAANEDVFGRLVYAAVR